MSNSEDPTRIRTLTRHLLSQQVFYIPGKNAFELLETTALVDHGPDAASSHCREGIALPGLRAATQTSDCPKVALADPQAGHRDPNTSVHLSGFVPLKSWPFKTACFMRWLKCPHLQMRGWIRHRNRVG